MAGIPPPTITEARCWTAAELSQFTRIDCISYKHIPSYRIPHLRGKEDRDDRYEKLEGLIYNHSWGDYSCRMPGTSGVTQLIRARYLRLVGTPNRYRYKLDLPNHSKPRRLVINCAVVALTGRLCKYRCLTVELRNGAYLVTTVDNLRLVIKSTSLTHARTSLTGLQLNGVTRLRIRVRFALLETLQAEFPQLALFSG